MANKLERWERRPSPTKRPIPPPGPDLRGVDPSKVARARALLGSISAVEAVEVALDLLVLDDAHSTER